MEAFKIGAFSANFGGNFAVQTTPAVPSTGGQTITFAGATAQQSISLGDAKA